jgi:hypothetical protein
MIRAENDLQTRDLVVRNYLLRTSTLDKENRSIEAVIATEAPVLVMDLSRWEPVEEILLMSGVKLPENRQVPMLDTHDRRGLSAVLGSTQDLRVEGSKLVGLNVFSTTQAAQDGFRLIAEGHITDNSIGYRVLKYQTIKPGAKKTIKGRVYTASKDRALRVSTAWEVRENSICSIGADRGAKNRNNNLETFDMAKANENNTAVADDKQTAIDNAKAQGAQNEIDRRAAITQLAGNSVPESVVRSCIDGNLTIDAAKDVILESMRGTMSTGVGSPVLPGAQAMGGISIGCDRRYDSTAEAMADAVLVRSGIPLIQEDSRGNVVCDDIGKLKTRDPHGRVGEFVSMRFSDMARAVLVANGDEAAARMSDRPAVMRALEMARDGGISTLSLPTVLGNSMGKSLRYSYMEYPAQWMDFCRRSFHNNFKDITRAKLTEIDNMEEVYEAGEYGYATIGEAKEVYKLVKYGKIFGLSWEKIVNDDLNAFNEIPRKMAAAARRIEDALAFGILTANAAMDDGTVLFHANHNNLGSAAAISVATLNAGKLSFRKQTSTGGNSDDVYINIAPSVLIVPAALEGAADKIIKSEYDPDDANGKTANIWKGQLKVCTHPILDATSATNWYLSSAPMHNGIEMCFLDGAREPKIERENTFEIDAVRFKVRHVCAAAAIEHRALYKNPYAG